MAKHNSTRNPKQFIETTAEQAASAKAADKKLALGLDFGTNCGYAWCWFDPGKPVKFDSDFIGLGQWDLSAGPYDSGAIRFVRLRQFVHLTNPQLVFYEDVKYTPSSKLTKFNAAAVMARAATACEFFGACKATVASWAETHNVPCLGVPIGTMKKRATGKGNANKPAMIAAVNDLLGPVLDAEGYETSGADNVADAFWALVCGLEQTNFGL